MTLIGLVSSEPIRARAAGIGIRYAELARALASEGFEVVLASPPPADHHDPAANAPPAMPDGVRLETAQPGAFARTLNGAQAILAQGPLANDVLLELPQVPTAIDLYDPWMVENFAYVEELGTGVFRNDHATWMLQLERGDFFLCSSEAQRLFYLGWLASLARVDPIRYGKDPDLRTLVDVVPFAVPAELPAHRPVLPECEPDERRILFGGIYDWLDPWPVLEALALLDRPSWKLLIVTNPNPTTTPQRKLAEVQRWCTERGWWGDRVRCVDWVAADRRFDLLRDVHVMAATHEPSLETRLSLRTRFLDALAAGLPVVATEGGALSRDLATQGAGLVVPPSDPRAVAEALTRILDGDASASASAFQPGAARILARHRPQIALAPLLAFCRDPRKDDKPPRIDQPEERVIARHLWHRLRARLGAGR